MAFKYMDYFSAPFEIFKIRNTWKNLQHSGKVSNDEKKLALEKYTLLRLQFICDYASKHIPFYKELFHKINFDVNKLDCYEYFRRIPIIDKSTVRANFDKMQSDEIASLRAVLYNTSGSTGTPLYFYRDKYTNAASFAMFWRVWEMTGSWKIGQKFAALTGYEDGKYVYQWKTRLLKLSSFHLNSQNSKLFYQLIKKFKPRILRGYPSALFLFGKLLQEQGLSLKFPVIITESETLLKFQKDFIEEFYGAKVLDHYSHWEGIDSIYTCEKGNKHPLQDFGYHEIIKEDNHPASNGETGKLICTGLYNRAMPLIRYDTRDLATYSNNQACDCGCGFPTIAQIIGRIEDVVVTPENNYVGRLDAAFKYSKNINVSYIYQPNKDNIVVNIVPTEQYNYEDDEKPLIQELRKRLGNTITIKIKHISNEDVPRTKGGKVRFVISDIPSDNKLGHI